MGPAFSLEDRQYSMLVVSGGKKFNSSLEELLPRALFRPVLFSGSVNEAKRVLAERGFDFVLVNSPLPDSSGVSFAIDLSETKETIALLLVRAELQDEIYSQAAAHGVFVLPKPTSKPWFSQGLKWLISARERLRRMQSKLDSKTLSLEEKMAEIRLVNRAKWLLIEERHMDEPRAHRYIEKYAMDQGMTRRAVAEEILRDAGEDIAGK